MADLLKRVSVGSDKRAVELLALLLLVPLLQSGFESSSDAASARERDAARMSHLAYVPSVREEGGRLLIEPPLDSKLSMRVVRLLPNPAIEDQNKRGPASAGEKSTSGAAQEIYAVIVSAP